MVVLFALGITANCSASNAYRWVDAQGTTHFSDKPPQDAADAQAKFTVIPMRAEVAAVARLRVDPVGDHYDAVVTNTLAGPLEVELNALRVNNFSASPFLPSRALLGPYASATVSTLSPIDTAHSGSFQLELSAVPGDPNAIPQPVTYLLPVDTNAWHIDQGWHSRFSHNDAQSGYAIDINVKEGTPILAARAGVVMQVESDFDIAGLNREQYIERANVIRIVHDDGSMAIYAHLKLDGALVRPGERVNAGQRIGYSGNTGYSAGPHLHFAVLVNRGMDLESIPFSMQGASGPISIPDAH